MISKYSHKGLTWVDLESPSEEEISHIIELHSIPRYIEDEIKINRNEDKISIDDDFIFAFLGIPHALSIEGKNNKVIFVVKNDLVLTIHDNPIHAFDKFGKEMELDIIVEEKSKIKNNNLLFAHILKNLYLNSEIQSVLSELKVKNLENIILQKNKRLKLFTILSILFLVTTIIFICL